MTASLKMPRLVTEGEIKVGDIGFAHTTGVLGGLIRAGEKLKWRECEWNHAFVVVSVGELASDIWIAEATLKGVVISNLHNMIESGASIRIVRPPKGADPNRVADFAHAQVGKPYGILSDLCIATDILTPDWFISVRRNGTWICSALAAEALRYGGVYFDWEDIYTVTPTQLWIAIRPTA